MAFDFSSYLKPIGVGSMAPASKTYTQPVSKTTSSSDTKLIGPTAPTTTTKTSTTSGGTSSKSSSSKSSSSKSSSSSKADSQKAQEAALQQEVDNLYKESYGYLSKQQQALEAAKPQMLQIAASPYEQALPQVQASAEAGRAEYGQGIQSAELKGRSLLSDAQRLANELAQRNVQAFGGGALSSTAQAAGELLGRETASQLGGIRQSTAQTVQGLQQNLINFNRDVETKVQQLNLQKNEALARAEVAFRDALSQIDSQRNVLAQTKAAQKLDALRNLRAQVANINAQETQFRQNIELMREQNNLNVSNQLSQLQGLTAELPGAISQQQTGLEQAGTTATENLVGGTQLGGNYAYSPRQLSGYMGNLFGLNREQGPLA